MARRVVAPYREDEKEVHMRWSRKKSARAGERPGRTAYQEIEITERYKGWKCVRYVFLSQRGKSCWTRLFGLRSVSVNPIAKVAEKEMKA